MGVVGVSEQQWLDLPQFLIPKDQFHVRGTVVLSGKEALHLGRARRLRKGQRVRLADGCGRVMIAEIASVEGARIILNILETLDIRNDVVPVTILLSAIRFERFDLAVSKLSEMGIAYIQPVVTERSRLTESDIKRVERRRKRWQGLCLEGLKQSRGFAATKVKSPLCLEDALEAVANVNCKVALLTERRGAGLLHVLQERNVLFPAALAVGPEGGFSGKEKDLLRDMGFILAGLGNRILRSETAAIYGAAIFSELFVHKDKDL